MRQGDNMSGLPVLLDGIRERTSEFDKGELVVDRLDGRGLSELQQRRLMAAFICDRGLAEQFVFWLDDNTQNCLGDGKL